MTPGIAPLTKQSVASVQNVAESGATAKVTCRVDVLLSPSPEVVRCGVVFVNACSVKQSSPPSRPCRSLRHVKSQHMTSVHSNHRLTIGFGQTVG